jgi:hypothetical protein
VAGVDAETPADKFPLALLSAAVATFAYSTAVEAQTSIRFYVLS